MREILTDISLNGNTIKDIKQPVDSTDAVNKEYVDTLFNSNQAYYYDYPKFRQGESIMIPRYKHNLVFINTLYGVNGATLTELQYDPSENLYETDPILEIHNNLIRFADTDITGDYYIDPINGDDSNPGTSPDQAWKSLENFFVRWHNDTANTYWGKTIVLMPGEHVVHASFMKNNGFGDSKSVWLFPLKYDINFVGYGDQTTLILDGEYSSVKKRTYLFVAPSNASFGSGVVIKNMHIRFTNTHYKYNYSSPIFARPSNSYKPLKLYLANIMLVSEDGKGLYYKAKSLGEIYYLSTNINGLKYSLSNKGSGSVTTYSIDSTYGRSVEPDAEMTNIGYNQDDLDGYLAWYEVNKIRYFVKKLGYTLGNGYARGISYIPTQYFESLNKIIVFGYKAPNSMIKYAIQIPTPSGAKYYYWNGTQWEEAANIYQWHTQESFNNLSSEVWQALLEFLKNNGYEGFTVAIYMENSNQILTPIYDYCVIQGKVNFTFKLTNDFDIFINDFYITVQNNTSQDYSNVRIQVYEV